MDFDETLAVGVPALIALMVVTAAVHAWRGRHAQFHPGWRSVIAPLIHLLLAGTAYWNLAKAGWLTATYHWNDPDDINLVLALFEGLCALAVFAFAAFRTTFLSKLLNGLLVIQLILAVSIFALVMYVVLTWKPRMI